MSTAASLLNPFPSVPPPAIPPAMAKRRRGRRRAVLAKAGSGVGDSAVEARNVRAAAAIADAGKLPVHVHRPTVATLGQLVGVLAFVDLVRVLLMVIWPHGDAAFARLMRPRRSAVFAAPGFVGPVFRRPDRFEIRSFSGLAVGPVRLTITRIWGGLDLDREGFPKRAA